jgi:hypothetical protein
MSKFACLSLSKTVRSSASCILLMLSCQTGHAAPANTVLSGALKCAVVGDDREWLDCYYGAAQPMRVSLGLPPANDAQLHLFSSPPSGPIAPQSQDVRTIVLSGAFSCSRAEGDRNWLTCFYAAAQPMRARIGLAPGPLYVPPPHPVSADAALPRIALGPHEVNGVRLRAYSFDQNGMLKFTLANGDVWRQVESDTNLAHWHGKPESYVATITKGFWGSFDLKVSGDEKLYKVHWEK